MPVVFAKPGTIKFRGRLRAQMQRGYVMATSLIHASDKAAARVPPVVVMTAPQRAQAVAFQGLCTTLLATLN